MTEKKSAWAEKAEKYYRISTYLDKVKEKETIKWLDGKKSKSETIAKALHMLMKEEKKEEK